MLKRKGQQHAQVKNVKVTPKNRIVVKVSDYTPNVSRRHPFANGNRNS